MNTQGMEPFLDDGEPALTQRDIRRVVHRRDRTVIDIYTRQLEIDKVVEFDRQDTEGNGEALAFAFAQEVAFLNHIRHEADGDRAVLELGARKLNKFSENNNRRSDRRFGRLLG
jgi:hypothetical protein